MSGRRPSPRQMGAAGTERRGVALVGSVCLSENSSCARGRLGPTPLVHVWPGAQGIERLSLGYGALARVAGRGGEWHDQRFIYAQSRTSLGIRSC